MTGPRDRPVRASAHASAILPFVRRRTVVSWVIASGAMVLAGVAACSSPASLVANGGECFQATDCQAVLVCIPQTSGTSICSSDLSSIQMTEDASVADGAAKTMMMDAAAAADGPTTPTDGAKPPPVDAGTPLDANMPPPVDANIPPPVDANMPPPVDANMPPPVDANMPPPVDAGAG